MKRVRYLINLVGAIVAIAIILHFIDPGRMWGIISGSKIEYILLAALAYLALNAVMAQRIRTLLSAMGKDIGLGSALKADFGGMLTSDFTPARSGYFLTAFLISSEHNINLEKTMLAIFGPQLFEFLLKAVCSALLFVLIIHFFPVFNGQELLVFVSIALIIIGIGFFVALLFHPTLLERFSFLKIGPFRKLFYLFHLMRSSSSVMIKEWSAVALLTLGAWILKAIEWYFIARAIGFTVIDPLWDFGFFLLFHPFVTFIHFLPLPTLAGAGTGEAAGSAILFLFGIPLDIGISFGFLARGMMIIIDLLGLSAVIPFMKKESLSGILKDIETIEERIEV